MIRLLWTASAEVRYFLRRYMPSNVLLDLIRTRKGLKWGMPAMLLAGSNSQDLWTACSRDLLIAS